MAEVEHNYAARVNVTESAAERVQSLIGVPIAMVSTAPDREHTIVLRHPYKT